jgi:hypothetical protein
MDAVHAFTVPPTGNVTLAEGRHLLGERIAMIAGVEPMSDPNPNLDHLRAEVRKMLAGSMTDSRLALVMAGYPHRTMAETRAILDECRKCGAQRK